MTDGEWKVTADPFRLLDCSGDWLSPRKLRLLGAAYARWLRRYPFFRPAADYESLAERVADGELTPDAAREMAPAADKASAFGGLLAPDAAVGREVRYLITLADGQAAKADGPSEAAFHHACDLIRSVVPCPLRPPGFDPRWRTETAVELARGIYADRAWDRLPILADALMDSGCNDADVLAHLRGPGPHCRGGWVVDLVLGKE